MMENIRLNKIIVGSAESGLKFQREDGSFPPGHNGPWNNPETPVRATSHWAILMLKAYELTKNKKFKEAAQKSGDYLIDKKNRPFNFSFFCKTLLSIAILPISCNKETYSNCSISDLLKFSCAPTNKVYCATRAE